MYGNDTAATIAPTLLAPCLSFPPAMLVMHVLGSAKAGSRNLPDFSDPMTDVSDPFCYHPNVEKFCPLRMIFDAGAVLGVGFPATSASFQRKVGSMNVRFRSSIWCVVAAMTAVVAMPSAHANPFYWDSNGTTAGLGDTGGLTWGTSANIASLAGGNNRTVVLGTFGVANTATTTAQTIYFGTTNLGLGSTASNILVGTRSINTIVFGQGQTNGVTLSGGTITLPASGGGVIANNTAPNTISSVFQSATTNFTKGGAGTVILTGANTYTGTTIVTGGGTLQVGNGTSGSLNGTTGTALQFNNGGGVFNVAEAVGSTQGMGTLTFTAGDGTVQSTYAGSGTTTLTFGSLAAGGRCDGKFSGLGWRER